MPDDDEEEPLRDLAMAQSLGLKRLKTKRSLDRPDPDDERPAKRGRGTPRSGGRTPRGRGRGTPRGGRSGRGRGRGRAAQTAAEGAIGRASCGQSAKCGCISCWLRLAWGMLAVPQSDSDKAHEYSAQAQTHCVQCQNACVVHRTLQNRPLCSLQSHRRSRGLRWPSFKRKR